MDTKNRDQLEAELLELIEQYLKKITPDHCDDDGIAAAAYFLLGEVFFSDSLLTYLQASASALAAFARDEVHVQLKKHMHDYELYILCDMLKRMIEFCNRVEQNEKIIAQFDQLRFEISDTSNMSLETILHERTKYEWLLLGLDLNTY